MIPEPLHPAVVHFPIVLAALLPFAALTATIAIRRGASARAAWSPVMVVTFLLAASAWVAVRTGEAEEDVVERVVAESAIHEHEERAEVFFPLAGGLLLLAAGGFLAGMRGTVLRDVTTVAAVGLFGVVVWVAASGGDLVYEHGAADAYVTSVQGRR